MYCHTVKNESVAAIWEQARMRVEQELQRRQEQRQVEKVQQQHQVPEREQQPGYRVVGKKANVNVFMKLWHLKNVSFN